jgi:N-acetylglucosamine kinase-like BadF-type ATPase
MRKMPEVATTLVVDVGQTATRSQLVPIGNPTHTIPSAPGEHLAADGAVRRLTDRLVASWRSHGEPSVKHLVVSTTGFVRNVAATALDDAIAAIGAPHGVIADDGAAEYVAEIGDQPGVLLIAGTGVVALAYDGGVRSARRGGWGWAIDDAGGGWWIGRQGLRSAAQSYEDRGGSARLLTAATRRFGEPASWPSTIYAARHPIGMVASFASDVLAVAEDGDPEAAAIWAEASRALVDIVVSAGQGADLDAPWRTIMVGGLTGTSASLQSTLVEAYRSRADVHGSITAIARKDLSAFDRLRHAWVVEAFPNLIVARP